MVLFTLIRTPPIGPILLLALFDMLSVPPPVRVTPAPPALTTINEVCVPVLLMFKWPPLVMVPPPVAPIDRLTPLSKLRLSLESTVRLVAKPLMSRTTGEAPALPCSMNTLLLAVGPPALHLLGLLQFPVPPSQSSF